jgi:hypothetical protein
MRQHALTILTPIHPRRTATLDAFLTSLGANVAKQTVVPFDTLDLLHFASWVIIGGNTSTAQLIFESNFDGEPAAFLDQLIGRARSGLDQIYQSCPGYPGNGSPDTVREYFLSHVVYTNTFYVGCVGLSRQRINLEEHLRERIENFLDGLPLPDKSPTELRQAIQQFVSGEDQLKWAHQPPEQPSLWETFLFWAPPVAAVLAVVAVVAAVWGFWGWPGVGVLIVAIVVAAGLFALILRRHEIADKPTGETVPDPDLVRRLAQREDHRAQNHLASVTIVKPGVFRRVLLKTVLAVINAGARYIENKGKLAGIPSIHFARWAVINKGTQLVFLSNFDGSWEHYLGEFIDQAAGGLTAVWSNAVGFPKTRWLTQQGARDEQRFKAYARNAQVYTQLWYSAYPYLTNSNIQNNQAIREHLWDALDADAVNVWLRRF